MAAPSEPATKHFALPPLIPVAPMSGPHRISHERSWLDMCFTHCHRSDSQVRKVIVSVSVVLRSRRLEPVANRASVPDRSAHILLKKVR